MRDPAYTIRDFWIWLNIFAKMAEFSKIWLNIDKKIVLTVLESQYMTLIEKKIESDFLANFVIFRVYLLSLDKTFSRMVV